MPRIRRRKVAHERLPVVPVSQRDRWLRDRLVLRERMARVSAMPHQLDDAALAALMVAQRADDDARRPPEETR